jgi:hypothetical protein
MSFNVRIFGYRAIVQAPVQIPRQDIKDSLLLLYQPYEFAALGTSSGSTPVTLQSPLLFQADYTRMLQVEIPANNAIRYEANPPQRSGGLLAAGANSPIMTVSSLLTWGPGWQLSFVDAASFP